MPIPSIVTRSLFVVLACCGSASAQQVAGAQSNFMEAFYGKTTAAQREEARQWSIAFWQRVESGDPQSVIFTQPAWQSPLFNPLRSTRATLERLNVIDPADCDTDIIYAQEGSPFEAKRDALRDSMIDGKFVTDPVTNPIGYQTHIDMIFDSPPGVVSDAWFRDGKLGSINLPVGANRGNSVVNTGMTSNGPVVWVDYVATQTEAELVRAHNARNAMAATLPTAIESCTPVTEAQQLLSGAESRVDQLERLIQQKQIEHGYPPLTTRYDIAFGVYGSLPMIQANLGGFVCFVDGVEGTVSSLSVEGVQLWDPFLYRYYEYDFTIPGSRILSKDRGCVMLFARTWVPWTVPTNPAPTLTPMPALPAAPGVPATNPGRPEGIGCQHNAATGVCTCTVSRKVLVTPCPTGAPTHPTLGCYVVEITECTWSVSAGGCPVSPPPAAPNWPGTPPAKGWPAAISDCKTKYGWWQ
jgi:hypothetical protein